MDSVKRYPILTAVLALCVAAFAVESFFVWRFNNQVVFAQRSLNTARSIAEALEQTSPAPNDDNKAAALKNVDDLQATLDKVTKTLTDFPVKITGIPTSGADLLVAIQGYVTDLQAKAKEKDVILPTPNFAFGMSMYIGQASSPPPDKIPAVYTQMKVLDYLLGHLMGDAKLDDQKMMLVSVMRENVAAPAPGTAGAFSAPPVDDSVNDIFVVPPTITARGPGVDTLAFQIKFIGYTESLRLLLSDLNNFDMPLVVRSIQVEHADESTVDAAVSGNNPAPAPATPADRNRSKVPTTRKPVVDQNLSQFTLVIEYIQLPPPAPVAAPDGTAAPAGTAATATTTN
jgi:hypothetical protein